jgi:hypothetical protein
MQHVRDLRCRRPTRAAAEHRDSGGDAVGREGEVARAEATQQVETELLGCFAGRGGRDCRGGITRRAGALRRAGVPAAAGERDREQRDRCACRDPSPTHPSDHLKATQRARPVLASARSAPCLTWILAGRRSHHGHRATHVRAPPLAPSPLDAAVGASHPYRRSSPAPRRSAATLPHPYRRRLHSIHRSKLESASDRIAHPAATTSAYTIALPTLV